MSSVEGILGVVQRAQDAGEAYHNLQSPVAERLQHLALQQEALAVLLGDYILALTQCQKGLDECLEEQTIAATNLGDASFELEVAAMGSTNPDLQTAASALSGVSGNTAEFGGRLIMASSALAGQRLRFEELVTEIQGVAAETGSMADQAIRHVHDVTAANDRLTLYRASVGG